MQIQARLSVHAAAPDRRRKDRIVTSIPVLLNGNDYSGHSVMLNDVSQSGFRLSAGVYVPPTSLVRLKIPGLGTVIGRVIWSKRGDIGGEFVNPVSEQRLMMITGYRAALKAAQAEMMIV